MTRLTEIDAIVIGGVDTHKDFHVAAVVDGVGRIRDTREFPATAAGYRSLLRWMGRHGELVRVGIEGDRRLWRWGCPVPYRRRR